jgi:hypothetical protein
LAGRRVARDAGVAGHAGVGKDDVDSGSPPYTA